MYRKVLIPLDGSDAAECVFPHVQAIARGDDEVDVVLLRVIGPLPVPGEHVIGMSEADRTRLESQYRSMAQSYLEEATKRLVAGGLSVRGDVVEGSPAAAIIDYADQNEPDLIIMATHGSTGMGRWALGSVADKVVRHVKVPVLLVPSAKKAA